MRTRFTELFQWYGLFAAAFVWATQLLLGFAVNDSGVVVTALVYLYLGPCLTLLALDAQHGEPELLEPIVSARTAAGVSFS